MEYQCIMLIIFGTGIIAIPFEGVQFCDEATNRHFFGCGVIYPEFTRTSECSLLAVKILKERTPCVLFIAVYPSLAVILIVIRTISSNESIIENTFPIHPHLRSNFRTRITVNIQALHVDVGWSHCNESILTWPI